MSAESDIVILRYEGDASTTTYCAPDSQIFFYEDLVKACDQHKLIVAISTDAGIAPVFLHRNPTKRQFQGSYMEITKPTDQITLLETRTLIVAYTSGDVLNFKRTISQDKLS